VVMAKAKPTKEFAVHPYVQFMEDTYHPYKAWLEQEGLPILSGEFVPDVRTMELGDWPRRGGKGAYLSFSDQLVADAYVAEIAPGGRLNPQHQLFEELILHLAGGIAEALL
jgi:hypothetical protein